MREAAVARILKTYRIRRFNAAGRWPGFEVGELGVTLPDDRALVGAVGECRKDGVAVTGIVERFVAVFRPEVFTTVIGGK